jgi:hypothetical protein
LPAGVITWQKRLSKNMKSERDKMEFDRYLKGDILMLGAHLIQKIALYLKLPSSTTCLAQIYFHSLYSQSSLLEQKDGTVTAAPVVEVETYCTGIEKFAIIDAAMGSLLLATKASENHRRVRDVVNMSYFLFHELRRIRFLPMPYVCDTYYGWRQRCTNAEIMILRAIGFQTFKQLPHGILINYLKALELLGKPEYKRTCQRAMNYLNDAFRSPKLALASPFLISCVAIDRAARHHQLELPLDWHKVFDIEITDLMEGCRQLDLIYKWRFVDSLPITPQELEIFREEYFKELEYLNTKYHRPRRRESSPSHQVQKSFSALEEEDDGFSSDFSSTAEK